MMAAVHDAILSVDLVVLMRDASVSTGNGDRFVLDLVKQSGKPAILVLNKIDKIKDKAELLPLIEFYSNEFEFAEIVPFPLSKAKRSTIFSTRSSKHLPEGEPIFGEDELTDQPMRVHRRRDGPREDPCHDRRRDPVCNGGRDRKIGRKRPATVRIYCAIYVERPSQKGIIIGKGGIKLKKIGTEARVCDREAVEQKGVPSSCSSRSSKTGGTAGRIWTKWEYTKPDDYRRR